MSSGLTRGWIPLFRPKLRKTKETRAFPDSDKSGNALDKLASGPAPLRGRGVAISSNPLRLPRRSQRSPLLDGHGDLNMNGLMLLGVVFTEEQIPFFGRGWPSGQ
jgi:hypothetical protein